MLTRTWMIIWKEFIQIFRDIRTLIVVLVMPFVMLVLYGYAINLDVKHLRLAVYDQDRSQDSRRLVEIFSSGEYFDVISYLETDKDITAILNRSLAKAVLVIPVDFAKEIEASRLVQVQLIIDGSDSTVASTSVGYAEAIVEKFSSNITLAVLKQAGLSQVNSMKPVDAHFRVWYNPELRSTNFIVPGLVAVILMMLSALLTSMTVVRERERGTIETLVVSPVKAYELIIGKIIPYVLIAFFDVLLVIIAGRLIFDVPLIGSAVLVLILSAIFLTAALGIGLLISVASKSQQTAMVLAMTTTLLPSILLSGFIFPVSSMPTAIRWITNIVPARHFIVILRGIFLKGNGLGELWLASLVLLLFGVVLLGLSSISFKKKI